VKLQGTVRSLTTHDTPEQNGVVEHLNRTLVEHARAMHYAVDLPKFLWPESIQHAVWLKNHTSTYQLNDKTSYELMFKQKPDITGLPEWGARVWVLKEDRGKLEAKADEGCWVGYSRESKAHRIYWSGKQRVTNECNVTFDNNVVIPAGDVPAQNEGGNTQQKPHTD
jgi:hypothetical protein